MNTSSGTITDAQTVRGYHLNTVTESRDCLVRSVHLPCRVCPANLSTHLVEYDEAVVLVLAPINVRYSVSHI